MLKELSLSLLLSSGLASGALSLASPAMAQQRVAQPPLRVVILPFRNLTEKQEDQWLSNSFAESLTMGLLKVKALQVIERGQISNLLKEQQFGQSGLVDENSAPRLGKLLGAKVVITGSFQKVGNQLQANVRFVNAETGQVDPERFAQIQGQFEQIFDLQNRLAEQLIQQLNVQAQPDEMRSLQAVLKATDSPQAYQAYMQGLEKLRQNNSHFYPAIIDAFEQALKADPNYALAYAGLAEVYTDRFKLQQSMRVRQPSDPQQANDRRLARQYAEKALALNPDLPEVLRALAKLDWSEGQHEKAMTTLKSAIRKEPQNTDSLVTYTSFRFEEQGFHLKVDGLKQELTALGANLQDPWIQVQLAAVGLSTEGTRPASQQNFGWVKELLQQAEKALPDQPSIPFLLTSIAQIEKDEQQQKYWFERAVQLSQEHPDMLAQLASQALQMGETQRAYTLIQQAHQLAPNSLTVDMLRANIMYMAGEKAEALQLYGQLDARTDNNTLIPYLRGINLFTDQQLDEAARDLELSLKRAQNNNDLPILLSSIQFFLAVVYMQQKQLDKALPLLELAQKNPIFSAGAYDLRATIYDARDQYDKALATYQEFLSLYPEMQQEAEYKNKYKLYYLLDQQQKNPEKIEIMLELSQLLSAMGHYDAALNVLLEVQQKNPQHPLLKGYLGYVHLQLKNWQQARDFLQQAVAKQPEDAKSWFNLALACQQLGDFVSARQALETVLRLEPAHSAARSALTSLPR